MTTTVSRAQLDEAGEALEGRIEHLSILTKADFDALMCTVMPAPNTQIAPLRTNRGPLAARPGAPEWLANHVVNPIYSDAWALPATFGALDFLELNSRASKLNGLFGTRYYEKTVNGRTYVILKGSRAQRTLLTGTRYRADNPKVLEMGIGKKVERPTIWGGMKVAFFAGVAIETFLWLFEDDYTISDMLGGIVAEAGKGVVASLAGALGAIVVGSVATFAFAPALGFIIVGAAAGVVLNILDSELGFKTSLQACTAIMLEFMRTHTGPVGTWTAEHYAALKAELDEWADGVRHSLDESLASSNERLGELIEESSRSPLTAAAYGQAVKSEAMKNGVLQLLRMAVGD